MQFWSLTVVFVLGRFFGVLKNNYSLRQFWHGFWLLNMTWALAMSINFLKVIIRFVKPPEKLVRFMVVRVEHNCSNRVRTWRTGNRPSHAVAQGVSFSIGGQPAPQLALVWRHRDVIVSTSSKHGNSESLITCSYKVFVYRRLFSNSY